MAVLVGIADGSDGGNEDGGAPIFFFSHQIQRPLSEIGRPPRGSSSWRKDTTSMSFRKAECLPSIL